MVPADQPSGEDVTPSSGYILVARLFPDDPSQAPLPPGQDSRLVGTACISLSADSAPVRRLPSANVPPRGVAYVSSMAVDPRVRRRGVARALLAACEHAARRAGLSETWLHVREADSAARALYDGAGYVAVVRDSWLDKLKHDIRSPRILMRRELLLQS
jgi:ribosomal protein S18 acetylase RimI-like enzyme